MPEPRWLRLGDICSIEKGNTGLAAATPGEYPLVATGAERRSAQTYQFDTAAVCIPLVSSTGHGKKTLNYVHFQEGKFALGTILAALIPKDEKVLDARYLHTYLQMNKDRVLVPLMRGAANVSLSVSAISDINIPVPPLPEQKKALSQLDSMSGEHAELLQETEKQLELLKQLRQQILQDAIEGKLTADWRKKNPALITGENHASKLLEKIKSEKSRLIQQGKLKNEKPLPPITEAEKPFPLPKGWVWCRLGDLIISAKDGPHFSPEYVASGIPFISGRNISPDGIDFTTAKFITPSYHREISKKCKPGKWDILYTKGGTTGVACVNISDTDFNVWVHVAVLKKSEHMSPFYVQHCLNSPHCYRQSQELTHGIGNQDLGLTRMINITTPLPPLAEQQIIASQIKKTLNTAAELWRQISERKTYSENLMQSVLREAFEK
jgi:type I restriction enzyme S subunit